MAPRLLWPSNLRPCARRQRCPKSRRLRARPALGAVGREGVLEGSARAGEHPGGAASLPAPGLRNRDAGGRRGKAGVGVPFLGTGRSGARTGEPGAGVPGTHPAPLARVGGMLAELPRAPAARPSPRGSRTAANSQFSAAAVGGKETRRHRRAAGGRGRVRPLLLQCFPSRPQVSLASAGAAGHRQRLIH